MFIKNIVLSLAFMGGVFLQAQTHLEKKESPVDSLVEKSEVSKPLFSPILGDISDKNLPLRINKSLVKTSEHVFIDLSVLGGKGNTYSNPTAKIILPLSNKSFIAVLHKMKNFKTGGYTWSGKINGIALSDVIFSVKDGIVSGKITLPNAVYEIRHILDETYAIQELDQSKFPSELDPLPAPVSNNDAYDKLISNDSADSCTNIEVMVVYSTEAKNAAGGTSQIEAIINLAIQESNQGYINSGLTQRLSLVHTMETNEASNSFSADLNALSNKNDGIFDAVDTARDAYAADMVSLIIENSTSCGLGYLNSSEAYAFSVAHRTCATGYYSFSHELGHNMGARHDWYVDDTDTGAKAFVNVADGWRTVMGYNTVCSDQSEYCSRILYWSNPNVNYGGDAMGVSGSTPTNCVEGSLTPDPSSCISDNRDQLNYSCAAVSNFRQSQSSGTPVVSNPNPTEGATVVTGASGQVLRIAVGDATSGTIYYDDDSDISFNVAGTISGGYMEITVPYANDEMNNNGTNYWYVEATNTAGTTRYPNSGNMSFTVSPVVNIAPTANAGSDVSINEGDTTTLNCLGTDSDGTITGYQWLLNGSVVSGTQNYTTTALLSDGSHTYSCVVTDNDGATGSDNIVVTVVATGLDDNYEENDVLAEAHDISSKENKWLNTINGYGVQSDEDWYKIYVNTGSEQVKIDLTFTHSEGDIDIVLYDSIGNPLASSVGVQNNESIDYTVSQGNSYYYLKVYYGNAGNTYNLWWDDISSTSNQGYLVPVINYLLQ